MKYVLMSILMMSVTGCVTTQSPDRIVIDRDGTVTIDNNSGHGKGKFCPPGQAKKGNC